MQLAVDGLKGPINRGRRRTQANRVVAGARVEHGSHAASAADVDNVSPSLGIDSHTVVRFDQRYGVVEIAGVNDE
jgi:hypothetical protein